MEIFKLPAFWELVSLVVDLAFVLLIVWIVRKTRLKKKSGTSESPPARKIGFETASTSPPTRKRHKPRTSGFRWMRMFLRRFRPYRLFHSIRVDGFRACYFFDYCPEEQIRSLRDDRDRDLILGFKDGDDTVPIYLLSEFIYRYIPQREMHKWMLCTIPSSTRAKNDARYRNLCERVADITGILNGFKEIIILFDRQDSRQKKEDDTVGNLQFGPGVAGKHVLLFDDIITRGTSFVQCAEQIMNKGAASVTGLFLGRTLR